jgi:hypothetical protein
MSESQRFVRRRADDGVLVGDRAKANGSWAQHSTAHEGATCGG